jgi:hypothetical protein
MRINLSIFIAIVSCIAEPKNENGSNQPPPRPPLRRMPAIIVNQGEPKNEIELNQPPPTPPLIRRPAFPGNQGEPKIDIGSNQPPPRPPLRKLPSIIVNQGEPKNDIGSNQPPPRPPLIRIPAIIGEQQIYNHPSQPITPIIRKKQEQCVAWGLPRVTLDVYDGAKDTTYQYPKSAGLGVDVYVLDTVKFSFTLGN